MAGKPLEAISLCTTHLNDWPAVRDFIESLLPQLSAHDEIVIVDAGSEGPSRAYLERLSADEPRVRVHVAAGSVRGLGRDLAWRKARNDIILHADADRTWSPMGWQRIRDLQPLLAKGPVMLRTRLAATTLGGFLLRRGHLERINGYDTTLQYFEDSDLERRLRRELALQEAKFDEYLHDSKRKMKDPRVNVRYYRAMFHDGARVGNSLWYLMRPSLAKPWRYPFLLAGYLAYRRGKKQPPARSLGPPSGRKG